MKTAHTLASELYSEHYAAQYNDIWCENPAWKAEAEFIGRLRSWIPSTTIAYPAVQKVFKGNKHH